MIIKSRFETHCVGCLLPISLGEECSWPSTNHPTSGVGEPSRTDRHRSRSNVDCMKCAKSRKPPGPPLRHLRHA